jgi:hypothetical protein
MDDMIVFIVAAFVVIGAITTGRPGESSDIVRIQSDDLPIGRRSPTMVYFPFLIVAVVAALVLRLI